ncbi:MAG: putative redox protein [Solirubrobacterales bacterium]|jgi:putative redox protein|nr:putative redox protein [Solirubrobacterales bacterium]
MKVVARRREGFAHDIEIEGGHTIRIDEPLAAVGSDTGPSPTRLVAASLAGCIAVTIEMYAERKGWNVGQVEVDVDVEYGELAPLSFAVTLRLPAELSDEQRARLLVITRKCPVHKLLAGETPVVVSDQVEPL